jgi:cytochrome P450
VDEVIAACYFFMTAARPALSDLLGNTLLLLSLHPDVLARLQREPAPVYSTVEEALRYLPPIWTARRTVIAPRSLALAGQNLPPDAQVCAWLVSANHDPALFAQPDRFDIERIPNRHLSFGDNGTFSSLGAGLARLVARLTLAAIAQRISDWELAPGDAVAVASPGGHTLGAHGPAGNKWPDRCSLTKLAVVFDARKPGAE